jgi:hypothetical protein
MERETFLVLAVRLKYLTGTEAADTLSLITGISKTLTALCSHLKLD